MSMECKKYKKNVLIIDISNCLVIVFVSCSIAFLLNMSMLLMWCIHLVFVWTKQVETTCCYRLTKHYPALGKLCSNTVRRFIP